ncbi:DUF4232 domain-containing protein [Streptomyces sp. NPDC048659]|uniref:DUF4232 domain-containing protein n=1 Tax=Streptomyces sp. NPDC048659 TaxID=3155489 RepID=UPI00341CE765
MKAATSRDSGRPDRWKTYALGAATVVALLTSTACASGSDRPGGESRTTGAPSATGASGTAATPSSAADPSGTASPKSPTTHTDSPTSGGTKASARPGGGSGGDDGSGTPLCGMADLSVSATNYDAKGEPVRHILLIVTNVSGKKCDLQGAPDVTLGNAKGPAPVKRGTDPGEPITLAPGAEAYAGLLATGGRMDTYDVRSMTLGLGSPGGETEPEKPVDVPMPVASFQADDGQLVTYWAGTEGLAMRPVTSS